MFEFFKNAINQAQGIDIKKEQLQKEISKKEKQFFLSTSTKTLIRIVAILYFLIAIFSIIIAIQTANVGRIIKISFLFLLSIATFILTLQKNKKAEIASLICVAVFMLVNGFIRY
ncbi:MAG: hypothetical protein RSA79_04455 [Oscillospiraceae bacterium]